MQVAEHQHAHCICQRCLHFPVSCQMMEQGQVVS